MNNVTDLLVPHLPQLDNRLNPYGSCNMTCLAMVLRFYEIRQRGTGQFEDELTQICRNKGWEPTTPDAIIRVARLYGLHDDFTTVASQSAVREHLKSGNPCIVHGWFTQSGHIIVLRGFDPSYKLPSGKLSPSFIANDPYGEYFESGYRTDLSGEGLRYSYRLIERLCQRDQSGEPDGQFWVHFISK